MKLLLISATFLSSLSLTSAHGATSYPQSRQWLCSGGASPNKNVWWGGGNGPNICKPALTGDSINTVITDWAGVSQGAAEGWATGSAQIEAEYNADPRARHVQVMPNGINAKICSAGDAKYSALNSPLWTQDQGGYPAPSTPADIYPTQMKNGDNVEFSYTVTAPHKTYSKGYIDSYITKDGTDFSKELTWNDLERYPFCHYVPENINTPLQSRNYNNVEKFECDIPLSKLGKHVIFQVWQRDDSAEAFYSCSDVVLSSSGGSDNSDTQTTTESNIPVTEASTTSEVPICYVAPDSDNLTNSLMQLNDQSQNSLLKYNGNCISHDNSNGKIHANHENCANWQILNDHQIQLKDSDLCWAIADVSSSKNLHKSLHKLETRFCDHTKMGQNFVFEDGMIKSFLNEKYCVGKFRHEAELSVGPCKSLSGRVHLFGV